MQIILSPEAQGLYDEIPRLATYGSAGYDLRACIQAPVTIPAHDGCLINTGIRIHIDAKHMAAFLFARSGLASKGITLSNGVGVIDSDYQNDIRVALWNRTDMVFTINPGDRIAQLVFLPVIHPVFEVVTEFSESTSRLGGFGSTGVE